MNLQAAMGGTSREYLLGRLRKGGHFALIAAIENGTLSCYQAAEACGFVTRRPILGTGSENATKRRLFQLRAALRNVDAQQRDDVLAPTEEARREDSAAVTTVAGGVGDLPCMLCSHPQAQLARREIADVFLENQLGNGNRRPASNGVLPRGCCRRNAAALDARAMIG
jgi:hypothetical protein